MPRINLAKLVTLNQGMEGEGELGSGGCGWHAGTKVSSAPAKIPGELRHCLKVNSPSNETFSTFSFCFPFTSCASGLPLWND